MKQACIALVAGLVLAATPAFATLNPGHNPAVETQQKQAPDIEKPVHVIVEKNPAALPLECRGYYVRMKSNPAPADSLNRCD